MAVINQFVVCYKTIGPLQLVSIILVLFSNLVLAQDRQCTLQQDILPGLTYYINNPGYPAGTDGRRLCQYTATSVYRIKIECRIDLPNTRDCRSSDLTIFRNPSTPTRYCGQQSFTETSDGQSMLIRFRNDYDARGSSFYCTLSAVTDDNTNCNCGWKKATKIVGGTDTDVNEYPMMAGVVNAHIRELICGATIISNYHVVTAAHCVEKLAINDMGVVIGEHDTSTGGETSVTRLYRTLDKYIHPGYNQTVNDIAIILINGTINYGPLIGPACLPFLHQADSFVGSYVTILGWGTVEFAGQTSNILQKADVSVRSNRQCQTVYPDVTYRQICTFTEGKDACQLDSGGPLLWQDPTSRKLVLIGVISYGSSCGETLSVNTRVGSYLTWIEAVTRVPFCQAE